MNDSIIHAELWGAFRNHIETFGHEGALWGIYGRLVYMILDGEISEDAARSLIARLDRGVKFHKKRSRAKESMCNLNFTPDGENNA
jgi:hypothetical protein